MSSLSHAWNVRYCTLAWHASQPIELTGSLQLVLSLHRVATKCGAYLPANSKVNFSKTLITTQASF